MYELAYLPAARHDMREIVRHISVVLGNPTAAEQLAKAFVASADELTEYPYSCQAYIPIRPLKHEYRKLLAHHYAMFYWVDERKHLITIARVSYAKRDREARLE